MKHIREILCVVVPLLTFAAILAAFKLIEYIGSINAAPPGTLVPKRVRINTI